MRSFPTRRRYVQLLGVSVALGLAGCTGDPDDDATAGDDDASEPGQTEPEDDGDSAATDNGDNGEAADDDDGAVTDDGSDSETADDDTGEGEREDMPRLRDVFAWDESHVMEVTAPEGTGRTVSYRGDTYTTWSSEGDTFEMYRIGEDTYTVMDGQCIKMSFDTPAEDTFDPEQPEEDDTEYVASGMTTINGEHVYQFNIEEGRYYLSVATGYPVRWESDDGFAVDFHSWGNTDPISPPDMECTEP